MFEFESHGSFADLKKLEEENNDLKLKIISVTNDKIKLLELENEKLKQTNIRDISDHNTIFNQKKKFMIDVCEYVMIHSEEDKLCNVYGTICDKLNLPPIISYYKYNSKYLSIDHMHIGISSNMSNCQIIRTGSSVPSNIRNHNEVKKLVNIIKCDINNLSTQTQVDIAYKIFSDNFNDI